MSKRILGSLALLLLIFASAAPVSAQEAAGPTYIVQPGDTLSSIAARFNIRVEDLMNANNITNPNLLSAGQQLVIPGLEGVSGVLETALVNFGDSYRSLTRRSQVPVELFQKLNRLVSPTEFYVGASMIVPQEGTGAEVTSTALASGESLLELAVRQNTSPWTVAGLNHLAGTWDGLPGDVLVTPGSDTGQPVSGLPPAFAAAQINGLPLKQGGTAVVIVSTPPGVTLGGNLVDHPLHFFPMPDGTQVALQGVHALLDPGVYPLRLDASLPDGSVQSYEQMVLVVSGNYLEDPLLPVPLELIDPAVTEPEMQQVVGLTLPATPTRYWTGGFISPASLYDANTFPTSRYGNRRTYIGQGTEIRVPWWHSGIDFAGGTGLPITAPAAGQVVFAQALTVRGNATLIDHGWGVYSGIWHQSEIRVQAGDLVEPGQIIGIVGGTGRVTGPHLHWELWVNGVQVDPLDWLNQPYP